jgi:hypothetical protein
MSDSLTIRRSSWMPDDSAGRTARMMVERLFVLMRTLAVHGPAHPVSVQIAQALADGIGAAELPFTLQFVRQAVFQDHALVMFDPGGFQRSLRVAAALDGIGVQEISVDQVPPVDDLIAFGAELAAPRGAELQIVGVKLRAIRDGQTGTAGETVEPERFAAVMLLRALMDAEHIDAVRGGPWQWSRGAAILRRLERATEADALTSTRFLEGAPGVFTVPRRAVQATVLALAAMRLVGLDVATRRVGAHAALAVCLAGLRARGGHDFPTAAQRSLDQLRSTLGSGRSKVDPHRLRTCAIVHDAAFRPEARARWHPVARLVELVYEHEVLRCPPDVDFDLDAVDLLSALAPRAFVQDDPGWLQALVEVVGRWAPGVRVNLDEGAGGVLVGGTAARPMVFTGVALRFGHASASLPGEEEQERPW